MLYNTNILRYPFLPLHPASSCCFNSSFSPKNDGICKRFFMFQRCKSWVSQPVLRQLCFLFCVFCVQLMVNCWFGARWFGFLVSPYERDCCLTAPLESQTTNSNQQLTISWCVWLCLLDFGLVPAPVSWNTFCIDPPFFNDGNDANQPGSLKGFLIKNDDTPSDWESAYRPVFCLWFSGFTWPSFFFRFSLFMNVQWDRGECHGSFFQGLCPVAWSRLAGRISWQNSDVELFAEASWLVNVYRIPPIPPNTNTHTLGK